MQWLLILIILAAGLALLFRFLPTWLSALLALTAVGLSLGLLRIGGLERAIAPLLLCILGLAVVPAGPLALAPALFQGNRVQGNRGGSRSKSEKRPKSRKGKKQNATEGIHLEDAGNSKRNAKNKNTRMNTQAGTATATRKSSDGSGDEMDIPGYEVLEKVGSGGMASVFKAKRHADSAIVALKIPMEQYVADAKFIRRFHREAEVALRLNHKNIVKTFEHGSQGIKHFMAMEYLDGRSLEDFITKDELDFEVSVGVLKSVVEALKHIHEAGIIHRDIKPANIMVTNGGIRKGENPVVAPDAVKLMDFGIAGGKMLAKLTMAGARLGTPVYMSPEQARGLKIDSRSDIYSLGLVCYEMFTGQTAFKGNYENIVHQQIFQTPPPPRQLNLEVPKALNDLVMWMIQKDPDERPTLDQAFAIMERYPFENEGMVAGAELPSSLVMAVNARQGVIRILDTEGNLHNNVGEIGMGENQFFSVPQSIAADEEGNFYITIFSEDDGEMVKYISGAGQIINTFGSYGMKPGEFLHPISVALGADCLYVLDNETQLVQKFDRNGKYLSSFGGSGNGRGLFNNPRLIKVGHDGSVYILDYGNKQVQRFDGDGNYQTRWGFKISSENEGMRQIDGMAVDHFNNLYISDAHSGKVRKISPDGRVAQSFSVANIEGGHTDALLDIGVDDKESLYVVRRGSHIVHKFNAAGTASESFETYAPVMQMVVNLK